MSSNIQDHGKAGLSEQEYVLFVNIRKTNTYPISEQPPGAGSVVCLCIRGFVWTPFSRVLLWASSGMSGDVWLIFIAASGVASTTGGGDTGVMGASTDTIEATGVGSLATEQCEDLRRLCIGGSTAV